MSEKYDGRVIDDTLYVDVAMVLRLEAENTELKEMLVVTMACILLLKGENDGLS